jgi:hypothetical protein
MQLARTTLFVMLSSFLLFGVATAISKDRKVQSSRLGYSAYAQQGPGPSTGRDEADSARSMAIKECNDKSAKISARDYQSWQLNAYRSCMSDHGQPE